MRDDGRLAQDARGFERHEFGIAGTETDAVKRAGVFGRHSASLASALTAAAAIALPPRRPLTIANGTRPSAAMASFDSAAPTNPTGIAMTAAGFGAPLVQQFDEPEKRRRRVADNDERTRQMRQPKLHRCSRSRVADVFRKLGDARIAQRADDFIVCRKPGAGYAVRDHHRVAKNGRAVPECRRCDRWRMSAT